MAAAAPFEDRPRRSVEERGASPPPGGGRRRLDGLQYLRALAASGVLAFHVAGTFGYGFEIGEAGVDLFFVLSGFLMVAITGERSRPLGFLADRARRIVPAYWFATSVMASAILIGLFRRARFDPVHVLASYLFVAHRDPATGQVWPLLVPGWTLNFEMMFYVVFAATMMLRDQVRQVVALTLLFAIAVTAGAILHPRAPVLAFYSDPLLLEFAAGCWLGLAWKGELARLGSPGAIGVGGTALAAALAIAHHAQPTRAVWFGIPAAATLAAMLWCERRGVVRRLRLPLLIGDASYSIYLWHTLATAALARLLSPLGLPAWLAVPVVFAFGLATGVIAYWLIERPFLRFFRERRTVGGVPVPAGP